MFLPSIFRLPRRRLFAVLRKLQPVFLDITADHYFPFPIPRFSNILFILYHTLNKLSKKVSLIGIGDSIETRRRRHSCSIVGIM